MRRVFCTVLLLVLLGGVHVKAQEQREKPTFTVGDGIEIKLIGRAIFDGGIFFSDKTELGNAVEMGDLRLGVTVNIPENWRAKLEIAFVDSKVTMRDVYVEYYTGPHLFRLGHAFETFGLEYRIGTTDIKFHTHATAARVFSDRRKLGISYVYNQNRWNLSAGLFSDQDVDNNSNEDEGYVVAGRFVFRPWQKDGNVLHVGASARFSAHGKAEANTIFFTGGAPTGLVNATFLRATVTEAINQWRFGTELIGVYDRFYMQGEYLRAQVNRFSSVENYAAQGGYMQVGYVLLNGRYGYNAATGMSRGPGAKSLELIARYSITDTNDGSAGIRGGRQDDLSVGAIYSFNRYLAVKANYGWVKLDEYASDGEQKFSMIQGRFQINF